MPWGDTVDRKQFSNTLQQAEKKNENFLENNEWKMEGFYRRYIRKIRNK